MSKKAKRPAARSKKAAAAKPKPAGPSRSERKRAQRAAVVGTPTEATRDAAVRQAVRAFLAKIPPAANSSGHYLAPEGGAVHPVPTGRYRLEGTDWIVTFKDGRLSEVARALPPAFGGPDVIAVANA